MKEELIIKYPTKEGIIINYDNLEDKICAARIIDGKKYIICKIVDRPKYFYCPHCKTENSNNIKERKINGEPEIKSLAYGYGWADIRYGKSYCPIIDGTKSRDYPVSVKFYCKNCGNEHAKPELLKALNERDKEFENKKKKAWLEVYEKMSKFIL
jgi:ribosomal protein L44E